MLAALLVFGARASADEREDATRAVLEQAARDGVPAEILDDKIKEGLAKGVPLARIAQAVRELERSLASARREAQPYAGANVSRDLLRAIVDAHASGANPGDVARVLKAGGREHALEVLTDLLHRGYPADRAARAVSDHAKAPDRLMARLERLRTVDGVPAGEALEELQRNNGRGPDRETEGERGHGPDRGKGH
jgi:hypothetical protein